MNTVTESRSAFSTAQVAALARLGIKTKLDLLYYFPREYVHYRRTAIARAAEGDTALIVGKVLRHSIRPAQSGLIVQTWDITNREGTASIRCIHFHRGSQARSKRWQDEQQQRYRPGTIVKLVGRVGTDGYSGGKTISAASVDVVANRAAYEQLPRDIIQPVYELKPGISVDLLQQCLRSALKHLRLVDPYPRAMRDRYQLVPIRQALSNIHFAESAASLDTARYRLIFDEFFYLQLRVLEYRQKRQAAQRVPLQLTGALFQRFLNQLPFQPTGAQYRVIREIYDDMQLHYPMNRLVQGDVGSGKTIVAVAAMLCAVECGYQAALMAPTSVLAQQHYQKVAQWLNPLQIPVHLLTGDTPAGDRRSILQWLRSGMLPIVVGTHALIQERVQFRNLALAVIDEQHRFGVEQRQTLAGKGASTHVLHLTATPIPRSLALATFGDMDVSQIDELPPGRQAIDTLLYSEQTRQDAYRIIHEQVIAGHQAYIVLPLIDESDKLGLKSAIAEYEHLSKQVFADFRVGLLHGRMKPDDKDRALAQFAARQFDILVSTSVIEVGVDVPNATVMMIEHAERFGLSQLHQLRGRVGRGSAKSYCLLVNTSDEDGAQERLQIMVESQDGFVIAQKDLQLRGPGDVFGEQQSGMMPLTIADPIRDEPVMAVAGKAAQYVLKRCDRLNCWGRIKAELDRRYANATAFD